MYGHPTGVYHEVLRDVPWAVLEAEDDRTEREALDDSVEDKLEQLGYV